MGPAMLFLRRRSGKGFCHYVETKAVFEGPLVDRKFQFDSHFRRTMWSWFESRWCITVRIRTLNWYKLVYREKISPTVASELEFQKFYIATNVNLLLLESCINQSSQIIPFIGFFCKTEKGKTEISITLVTSQYVLPRKLFQRSQAITAEKINM